VTESEEAATTDGGASGVPEEDGSRITFACCVEYGTLEEGTVRLVESLRQFGGSMAGSRVIAVTPRRGAPLRPETLRRFSELGIEYVRTAPRNRYTWMAYTNKYFALREAEKRATGDLVAWVDSDVLVTRPPTGLLLSSDEDFGSCPRDKNIGTTGPGDEYHDYWLKVSRDAGQNLDDLPWVTTTADHARIRLYWNAGIFVYRPASGFLDTWHHLSEQILDATDASTVNRLWWTDQVALSFAAMKARCRIRNLGGELNYGIASYFKDHLTPDDLADSVLMHYHDSMSP